MDVVALLRVSTKGQGESGLGLDAQREYIQQSAKANGWNIVNEYIDVGVSGSVHPLERPAASKAFATGLPVVVAKLDRLSRDVEHIAGLMKRANFKVASMPKASTMELHIYAMLAQQEREFIAQRTKDGLKALANRADAGDIEAQAKIDKRNAGRAAAHKAHTYKIAQQANKQAALARAEDYASHIKAAMFDKVSTLKGLAEWLNTKGIASPKGVVGSWQAVQVSRLLSKLDIKFP
ncbi:recombinase family protein [Pseudomonas sp. 8O]|uniref:recombinase family protein n=1 Tax=Pseudomonas sp. 8O TaxID=2653165 RepID=UPI0012F03E60|nr:recombinase family protein [Pseudomonas sp. 8O]VXB44465.1 Serine recombinase [Pseudomonas sp. 8O]